MQGASTKIASAPTTAITIVKMISLRPSSSSSSPDFSADHERAWKPRFIASISTNMPLRKGTFARGFLAESAGSSFRFASMMPSGRRAATAQASGARIMTPSMTAWPPTDAPGDLLNYDSVSASGSGAASTSASAAGAAFFVEVWPYRLRNRSTRPVVSTRICLPV